jgi:SNF2 family DNA or RNA helicase
MGTGKTITALQAIVNSKLLAIAVVPAFLRLNWLREVEKHFPDLTAEVWTSKTKGKIKHTTRLIIMSYEAMSLNKALFKKAGFIIFDEAHYLGSHTTQRTKCALEYIKEFRPQKLLLMSGTPIRSRVTNLYPALKMLSWVNSNSFNETYKTHRAFCCKFSHEELKKINGFIVTEYVGIRNTDELKAILRPQYVKNRLSSIADLPDLQFVDVYVDLKDKALETKLQSEYNAYVALGIATPEDYEGGVVGEHISTAKALSALHKSDEVAKFAAELIESGSTEKVVVFTDHRDSAKNIEAKLYASKIRCKCIMGGMSDKFRDGAVNEFQTGSLQVLVGTIGAMSAGLTLTAAHIALFCDLSWVPANNKQAYARIHRISQTKKCIIYRFVSGKIDETIQRNIREKEKVITELFDRGVR